MSMSVSLSGPCTPSKLAEIQKTLEAVKPRGGQWSVDVSVKSDAEGCTVMRINGPAFYRRVYDVFGGQDGYPEPAYLESILRSEINAFPSSPPREFAFALAELSRLHVAYDDSKSFSGEVIVDGRPVPNDYLAELYRSELLASVFAPPDRAAADAASQG